MDTVLGKTAPGPHPAALSPVAAQAQAEKNGAALSSVWAAIFLTGMKIVVGVLTGSLGILAEAAHSGLDLVAAAVTLFAVKLSGRPADREHAYGHGKIENLSALFEAVLLLVTCAWIIYEAIRRLFFEDVAVEANFWAFLVMAISIAIDYSRSRLLLRMAKKHNSQALEADALHFSTDIWSSSVVIGGLLLVLVSNWLKLDWLAKADAVAALGVSGIVIYISLELGRKTIQGLLDGVPANLNEEVRRAAKVPGVVEVKRTRVRHSGPDNFADVVLSVDRQASFEHTHDIASQVEAAVQALLPGADVVVHVEPHTTPAEDMPTTVRRMAARQGLAAHNIRLLYSPQGQALELHLEISDNLQVGEAHAQASAFEEALRREVPELDRIVTHLEPVGIASASLSAMAVDTEQALRVVGEVTRELGMVCQPHDVQTTASSEGLTLSCHYSVDAAVSLTEAHRLTEQFESALRARLPALGRVIIHVEPVLAKAD
jgi:cation diffusion facilitator family transporter